MPEIVELTTEEEIRRGFAVMRELRNHLSEAEYMDRVKTMSNEGYRQYAHCVADEIVAIAGVITLTNLYYGKHLFVYDLVTKSDQRSKGYGEKLLTCLGDLARQDGSKVISLSSGLERHDAHRFYEERMGYEKPSYVFKKTL